MSQHKPRGASQHKTRLVSQRMSTHFPILLRAAREDSTVKTLGWAPEDSAAREPGMHPFHETDAALDHCEVSGHGLVGGPATDPLVVCTTSHPYC